MLSVAAPIFQLANYGTAAVVSDSKDCSNSHVALSTLRLLTLHCPADPAALVHEDVLQK